MVQENISRTWSVDTSLQRGDAAMKCQQSRKGKEFA